MVKTTESCRLRGAGVLGGMWGVVELALNDARIRFCYGGGRWRAVAKFIVGSRKIGPAGVAVWEE